ncbi:phenylalanine--tRNA ligase subunit beta, partial [bacterium]|nr:phenylalanine--tRNA ligase subunit beta [bacterium]
IKLVNIRGIKSEGMMCSAKELGISDDMSGLLILPRETSLGKEIKKVLSLPDIVFDLEITPNRADCLSLIGIAREIAATLNIPFKLPEINLKDTGNEIGKQARVTIKEPLLCPRYLARVIRNVKISPSPFWLQRRLEMVGLRAINNVVDATNYVLMELGHPLHAFDYDQINNHHIIVRRAEEKEKFKTLEGMEYTLDKDMLVIADEKKTVALAGIMGGSNSQVNNETCNLLIESAYFDAINIRRTSKKLGLTTESSYRFERGTDFEMAAKAINRVTSLIREIAGGQVVEGIIDQYPQKIVPHNIILRPKQVNRILGIEISKKQILDFLNRLGFECDLLEDNANLKVKVPAFRQEVTREIDLIEEIARIYKYDEIPPAVPRWKSLE